MPALASRLGEVLSVPHPLQGATAGGAVAGAKGPFAVTTVAVSVARG